MSRPIDADKLIERIKKTYCEGCDNYNGMRCKACPNDDEIGDIDSAPTIDAVSVVRCKECKWAKANGTYQWCGRLDSTARITAYDFCSYGERKGE